MKTVSWLAAAAFTLASLPLTAQINANVNGEQSTSASAGSAHASDSSSGNANSNLGRGQANTAEMRPVTGELQGNLDAKSAKPGQPVALKTTRKMRTADGIELPKGTRLLGHVTQVQAHGKGHADSQLGLAFDRAELKGGRTIPIRSMIESIEPRPSAMMADPMAGDGFAGGGGGMVGAGPAMAGGGGMVGAGPAMAGGGMVGAGPAMAGGGGMGAGPAMASGGGRLGGGVLGGGAGMAGGAVGGIAGAGTRMGEGVGQAADGTLDTTGRMAGNTAGMVETPVHGTAGASGSLAAHATGIPCVLLSGDATGSASGMLSATNRNVHLDSGTQMVLGIAAAAQ